MILGSHSVWVSGSVEMLLEVAVTKICSYCPQNVILPILVMHFITMIVSKRLRTFCKSHIHARRMEIRVHKSRMCDLKFPGHVSTGGRVQVAKNTFDLFCSPSRLLKPFPPATSCSLLS